MQHDNYALLRAIRERPDLTATEKCVAYTLASYRNSETGLCFPSQQRLATKCGFCRQHVSHLLKSLKNKKIIKIENSKINGLKKAKISNYIFLIGNSC